VEEETVAREEKAGDTPRRWPAIPIAPLAALVIFAVLWEAAVQLRLVNPIIVPPLSAISADFVQLLQEPAFPRSLMTTFVEMLVGFAIGVSVGLTIGILGHASRWFRVSVLPYVVMLQSMPRVALAPLFLIWLGFGLESKIAIAAAVCFFPVAMNTVVGLESADEDQTLVIRSLGASHVDRLRLLTIPSAAPYIFAGVKTAIALALSGAIVAEFISSSAGLGFMIASATFLVDVPRVFSILLVLALMGGGMYWIVDRIDRHLVFWRTAARNP
jgi:NitT/TauT family transport system permease protein